MYQLIQGIYDVNRFKAKLLYESIFGSCTQRFMSESKSNWNTNNIMLCFFCYKVRLCPFPLDWDRPAETNESIIVVCRRDSPTDTAIPCRYHLTIGILHWWCWLPIQMERPWFFIVDVTRNDVHENNTTIIYAQRVFINLFTFSFL